MGMQMKDSGIKILVSICDKLASYINCQLITLTSWLDRFANC